MKMFDIGQVVMNARKAEGLNQAQLAEKCGLARSTISLIENGSVPDIGMRKMIKLLNSLKLEFGLNEKAGVKSLNQMTEEAQAQFKSPTLSSNMRKS